MGRRRPLGATTTDQLRRNLAELDLDYAEELDPRLMPPSEKPAEYWSTQPASPGTSSEASPGPPFEPAGTAPEHEAVLGPAQQPADVRSVEEQDRKSGSGGERHHHA